MSDVLTALSLALTTENAELRQQLASAEDILVETAIDAGNMQAFLEATPWVLTANPARDHAQISSSASPCH